MESLGNIEEGVKDAENDTDDSQNDMAVPTFGSTTEQPDNNEVNDPVNEPMVVDNVPDKVVQSDADNATNVTKSECSPQQTSSSGEASVAKSENSPAVTFTLNTVEPEKTERVSEQVKESPSKDNYVSEFHRFLQQENKGMGMDSISVPIPIEPGRDTSIGDKTVKQQRFDPTITEETSNSSWYKINSENGEKMESCMSLPQDETSNMSGAGSCISSNIGDASSFPDQASNIDEGSNLSIPDENSVPAYSGHQPVFDESANMNPPSNSTFARPDTPNSERDKNAGDSTPAKKFRRGTLQIAADDASEHGHGLTAEDIFEYQWPQEKDAEFYMLQEQISMFLDVKSFKRKYPDLFRRICDKQEKDFLRDKGVVSETQSDLGLTALKADEVHDLMGKDYPARYKEFIKVLHEREKQKLADKMKEIHALKLEKDKMVEYTKKAMKSVSDWNRNMLKEKNEERRAYFDMQTFTIQYPKNKFRKLDPTLTEVGAYPLAVIPGQFQDEYRNYTMEELKSFPLNTAIIDPPSKGDRSRAQGNGDDQNSGSDSDADSSSSSSSDDDDDDSVEEAANVVKEKSTSREVSKEKSEEPKIKVENNCRMCKDEPEEKQKILENDRMIECSECKSQGHPSCLDLTEDMVKVIKTYPWQCMECKTCVQCMDPYDEDKMLFCDNCDRGYHTFCVGLKSLPTGQWDCFSCRGDTTPIKPLPRPTPKAKRGRKSNTPRDPNTPRRPPGRPPKDKSKIEALKASQEAMLKLEASGDNTNTSETSQDVKGAAREAREARQLARHNKDLNQDSQKDSQKDSQIDSQKDSQIDSQMDSQKDSQKDSQNDLQEDSQKDPQNDTQKELEQDPPPNTSQTTEPTEEDVK